jgi:hypothetical protein
MKKKPDPEFIIIHVIANQSFAMFHEEVERYCRNKKILLKRKGVSLMPIAGPTGMGMLPVPYCYIETEATEEEHRIWKFGQTIKS